MNSKFFNVIIQVLCMVIGLVNGGYMKDRSTIIKTEQKDGIGANLILSRKELAVNNILMRHKLNEINDGVNNSSNFLPAQHFFISKKKIEESNVFKIIKCVPKGGSLHSHDSAFASGEYVYNLTYQANLHACIIGERLHLHFAPDKNDSTCTWQLVSDLRNQYKNFDKLLRSKISLVTENPAQAYPTEDDAWRRFGEVFATVGPMIYYEPVFKDYFYQALKELAEDNVMYAEFRSPMHSVYNASGYHHESAYIFDIYFEAIKRVKKEYRNFYGAKMIYSVSRHIDNPALKNYLKTALELEEKYPDFIAGFDLVGQEDKGKPLIDFIKQLLEVSNKTKFFFHAGETNWNGMSTDFNLVDAALLNTTRIGHGYDLLKHQKVLQMVKEREIAIEVSPISNQVLKLVEDMRNHPASVLMNQGFNVVICNDDPSFWGAKGLSYDWYMAFMGMASFQSDLRFLKQLAMNSLLYSAMEDDEKQVALKKWEQSWENFLDEILEGNCLN